ncbi:hypothetical protein H6P81_010513 [Aristolochia fimbriata]|uniref:Integrase catalytic domain-containing protein n=1 Tax=Aristolochia fimbriata TaxID=158543 RepID=A0AAV7ENZ3_ARIFI|nr:hypothetical protein H6P81_010513 [Aristolochia fimbriata]
MDIIGPITPKSNSDWQYILAATDYFSKWAEAGTYREVKATTIIDFIRTQIIYRYGVHRYIVTDNSTPFRNKVMDHFCQKFCIQQRTSLAYNPEANGLADEFNKMPCKILKKIIGTHKKSWDEKLGEALWAYRTSFQTTTKSTPYSLVYGTEAVLPLERRTHDRGVCSVATCRARVTRKAATRSTTVTRVLLVSDDTSLQQKSTDQVIPKRRLGAGSQTANALYE